MRTVSSRLTGSFILSLASALGLSGCGSDALECSAPAGSFATDGMFEVTYVDELAPFSSTSLRPRLVRADADAIELWACEQRGEQMWIVEATVSRPASGDLPAEFSRANGTATIDAVMTRYDSYRVIEEPVADTLAGRISGTLRAFDGETRELDFDALLAEDYVDLGRLPAERTLTLAANLSW